MRHFMNMERGLRTRLDGCAVFSASTVLSPINQLFMKMADSGVLLSSNGEEGTIYSNTDVRSTDRSSALIVAIHLATSE